jgi:enamine deaminase RidA (YjgF/YER057c/UK114 family)
VQRLQPIADSRPGSEPLRPLVVSVRGERIARVRLAEHLPEPISHYTDPVRAGDTLCVSGLLAVDRAGALIGGSDVTLQPEQVFNNLTLVLNRARVGFDDVVKVVSTWSRLSTARPSTWCANATSARHGRRARSSKCPH